MTLPTSSSPSTTTKPEEGPATTATATSPAAGRRGSEADEFYDTMMEHHHQPVGTPPGNDRVLPETSSIETTFMPSKDQPVVTASSTTDSGLLTVDTTAAPAADTASVGVKTTPKRSLFTRLKSLTSGRRSPEPK